MKNPFNKKEKKRGRGVKIIIEVSPAPEENAWKEMVYHLTEATSLLLDNFDGVIVSNMGKSRTEVFCPHAKFSLNKKEARKFYETLFTNYQNYAAFFLHMNNIHLDKFDVLILDQKDKKQGSGFLDLHDCIVEWDLMKRCGRHNAILRDGKCVICSNEFEDM